MAAGIAIVGLFNRVGELTTAIATKEVPEPDSVLALLVAGAVVGLGYGLKRQRVVFD